MNSIETVSIDITYECNFRCLHCFNSSGEHDGSRKIMTDDEIFNIVKDLVKLSPRNLCFCGGETMLRKDLLIKCAKYINENATKKVYISAVSNGYLINDSIAMELKQAGLSSVQISFDGAKAESHEWLRNKEGSFERAINAIKCLKRAGLSVAVAFTPTKRNINEIEDAFELVKGLGVSSFRVQPIMSLGRAKRNLQDYFPDYEEYAKVRFKLLNKQKDKSNKGIYIEWGDPLMHLTRGRLNSEMLYYITINAYGELLISPYIPVSFGNIKQISLFKYIEAGLFLIWENKFVKKLSEKMNSWDKMDVSSLGLPEIFVEKNIDLDLLKSESDSIANKYMSLL